MNEHHDGFLKGLKYASFLLGAYLAMAIACYILSSCKGTERIVEVPITKTEYKDRVMEKKDSVYIHDSTYMCVGGDTIYVYQYRNVYRDKLRTDTLYINRTDSIAVPYPIERQLSAWEMNLINLGKFFFVVLLCVIAYVIFRIVWHRIRSRT